MKSYKEAKLKMLELGIKSKDEYFEWWVRTRPSDMPKDPEQYYKKIN